MITYPNDLPQNMWQHLSPPRPVVIHVVAPQLERVRDPFSLEDVGQVLAALRIFVRALARKDVDRIRLTQNRQKVIVIQSRKIISRVIKKDVVVVIAIQV